MVQYPMTGEHYRQLMLMEFRVDAHNKGHTVAKRALNVAEEWQQRFHAQTAELERLQKWKEAGGKGPLPKSPIDDMTIDHD